MRQLTKVETTNYGLKRYITLYGSNNGFNSLGLSQLKKKTIVLILEQKFSNWGKIEEILKIITGQSGGL